jgi:hypothetical protein
LGNRQSQTLEIGEQARANLEESEQVVEIIEKEREEHDMFNL